jgi:transcriptional regulator with XRE-family HTH domain
MPAQPVGDLLREWRQRRRMSQLDLACEAEISTRHLSFVETGRARPSRDMLLHLAERLDIPLRERNRMLLAAGFAPSYAQRPLEDPALKAARTAVEMVLAGHEPYPALAVDRHWTLVAANTAVSRLIAGAAPFLLQPPVNVLRLALHPQGLAPRIANLAQWRAHLLGRLRRQIEMHADPVLATLFAELACYPAPRSSPRSPPRTSEGGARALEIEDAGVVVPLQLASAHGPLSLVATTTVFGTPLDITLAELALESLFPADAETGERLRRLAA